MSEKTEQPTDRRIEDARKDGQVAKSHEINMTIQLLIVFLWLIVNATSLYTAIKIFINNTIGVVNLPLQYAFNTVTGNTVYLVLRFVFIPAGFLIILLTLAGLLQTNFLFAPKAVKFDLKRISILSNTKQLFSIVKLFDLFKMIIKITILVIAFNYLIDRYAASFVYLTHAPPESGLFVCSQMIIWMISILLVLSVAFSMADHMVQRFQLRKQLMMSKEDIKQEYKNTEGNPEIKSRQRELHREVQSGSLSAQVNASSVVIRNPVRIAVCIQFRENETLLPKVLTYGKGKQAGLIVALAEKNGIPIVENIPLAQALILTTKPGDYIPEALFAAVAQVLRFIQDKKNDENN